MKNVKFCILSSKNNKKPFLVETKKNLKRNHILKIPHLFILCNVPFPMRVKKFLIIFFNVHCSIVFLKATNHFAHGERKVQLVL